METKGIANAFGVRLSPEQAPTPLEPGVELHIIGIGAKRLAAEVCRNADGIILAGIAGGLDPVLGVGDVVMDGADSLAGISIAGRRGKIASSLTVVSTPAEKRALFEQTGAAAVDMESDAVRAVALAANVPLLIVRAISDAAEDELPLALFTWIDEFGKPNAGKMAVGMARNPALVGAAMRLGKKSNLAVRKMAGVVREIVRTLRGE
jgi:hypothetical protein